MMIMVVGNGVCLFGLMAVTDAVVTQEKEEGRTGREKKMAVGIVLADG